ncbi:hypothetical protein TWF281_006653 [Arthrobotrys megalospora]
MNTDFQEFTWNCRRGADFGEIPRHLQYLLNVDMIIAHILIHKNVKYIKMNSWEDIKPSDLLKVEIDAEERLGIQWVFRSIEARDLFGKHCHGKVKQYNLNRLCIGDVLSASKTAGNPGSQFEGN